MRFVNTKAFLSILHLESHYDTIKEHIHHINKDCLYKFTKQQAWDNTFIRRLAIMYVITSYYLPRFPGEPFGRRLSGGRLEIAVKG